jgi:hypothetical protein
MGVSVSSAGDVNGDGYSDVIVGAFQYNNGQTDEGPPLFIMARPQGSVPLRATMIESNQAFAFMGNSVASAGDVNGDGYSDVIVGAYQYDNGETGEGAAFVYHGSATGISTTAAATLESNQAGAQMGASVASAGDVNGDGYSDVIVGAYGYDNGQTDEGAAFIYHGSAAGLNTVRPPVARKQPGNRTNGPVRSRRRGCKRGWVQRCHCRARYTTMAKPMKGPPLFIMARRQGSIATSVAMIESNQVGARWAFP